MNDDVSGLGLLHNRSLHNAYAPGTRDSGLKSRIAALQPGPDCACMCACVRMCVRKCAVILSQGLGEIRSWLCSHLWYLGCRVSIEEPDG